RSAFGLLELSGALHGVDREEPMPDGTVQHRVKRSPISIRGRARSLRQECVQETLHVGGANAVELSVSEPLDHNPDPTFLRRCPTVVELGPCYILRCIFAEGDTLRLSVHFSSCLLALSLALCGRAPARLFVCPPAALVICAHSIALERPNPLLV